MNEEYESIWDTVQHSLEPLLAVVDEELGRLSPG
jgi:hypothetical protein